MRKMNFSQAIDDALAQSMTGDKNIIVLGEDTKMIRRELPVRFGPRRI